MSDDASELPSAFSAELRELIARALSASSDSAAIIAQLRAAFEQAIEAAMTPAAAEPAIEDDSVWHGMIGRAPAILELRERITKFARSNSPVLIRGESGTGKDLVARILHQLGPRAARPYVAENCAAIPETLLESVLFGHVRGAFTGAVRDHEGHFVAAHRGTLFLDEIGDTPLPMQAKLLRALQEGEVRPVGGQKVRKVDVRVIAATNRDLEALVAAGKFRQDLFYRLNVLELWLPPLRDRGEDVVLLARRLLALGAERSGRTVRFDADAEARLLSASWPGNIRQLQNEIQRLLAMVDAPIIAARDLSPDIDAR
ncbi:MAG: sigma 54-interacting transcriptional regulator [Planctomycetota bacterium]